MNTSCIRHPENNRYIQLYEWQIRFCQENHCAALLLSFFLNWHDWKIRHDKYYRRVNDIAEMHGDGRTHTQNAYLFFTVEELIAGCMNFYGKDAINSALRLLESLHVITIHKNPNPRYHFDKTKYFKFYPRICNQWIANNCPVEDGNVDIDAQPIDLLDNRKVVNRNEENRRPTEKISYPSAEISQAITNTTNYTTNKDQSIITANVDDDHFAKKETPLNSKRSEIQAIIDVLISIGMHPKRMDHPDVSKTLQDLYDAGATPSMFCDAYLKAVKTAPNGFGINYIAKVVQGSLDTTKPIKSLNRSLQKITSPPKKCFVEDIPEKNWIQGK